MEDKKIIQTIEKTVSIDKFIGVYDNYILPQECEKVINIYEAQNKFNNTLDRMAFEKSSILSKKDKQFFAVQNMVSHLYEKHKERLQLLRTLNIQ